MTTIARSKNFLQSKTLTANDIKSFVDIKLKTISVIKLDENSPTGYKTDKAYESVVTINSSAIPISISGSEVPTIGVLVSKLNTELSGSASALFLGDENKIRIVTVSTGAIDVEATEPGSLISGLIGTSASPLSAGFQTPCIAGGVNFELTNVASSDNPVNAGFISKARTSAGADIAITEVYDNETGILQVKKASGSFSVGDEVTAIGNLIG
jgi:hypothetical protein